MVYFWDSEHKQSSNFGLNFELAFIWSYDKFAKTSVTQKLSFVAY